MLNISVDNEILESPLFVLDCFHDSWKRAQLDQMVFQQLKDPLLNTKKQDYIG